MNFTNSSILEFLEKGVEVASGKQNDFHQNPSFPMRFDCFV